jgi:HlyD family secretion protein
MEMRMKRWWILLVPVAILALGAVGYAGFRSAEQPAPTAAAAPATVAVTRGDVQQTVTAPGKLVGTQEIALSMGTSGRIAELDVRPGDEVKQGQVLAALDTGDLQLDVAQAQQSYLIAQAHYSSTVQADPNAVAAARAALSSANTAYQTAQQNLGLKNDQIKVDCAGLEDAEDAMLAARDAYNAVANDWKASTYPIKKERETIYKQTTNNYELAVARCNLATSRLNESDLRSAQAQVAQAKENLEKLIAPRSETVATAQAEMEKARLTLEQAQAKLAGAQIVAPFDGAVLEVKARLGESAAANSPLIILSDPHAVEAETSVIEEDLPLVKAGQPVELFFDAQPEAAVVGRVDRIVPQRTSGDRPLYPVYIAPDEVPDDLVPGMTVDASIVIDSRSGVLRLPRALVRARSDNSATVKVWTGDRIEERTIKTGLRGDLYVEIVEGLQEGDRVVGE